MLVLPSKPKGNLDSEAQMMIFRYDPIPEVYAREIRPDQLPAFDEEEYEARMRKFRDDPIPEEFARERCPICCADKGKCCHFGDRFGRLSLKMCLTCGKFGEHWFESCPDRAIECDTVTDDKHPELELEGVAYQLPALDEEEYEARMRKFRDGPIPEEFARERCPICCADKGKCCHFGDRFGRLSLKMCFTCGKFGEHWFESCPDRAVECDTVTDDKHPELELEGVAYQFPAFDEEEYEARIRKFRDDPIPEEYAREIRPDQLPAFDEEEYKARMRKFRDDPIPEEFARERCPICCADKGKCCHFGDRFGRLSLKMCLTCGKFGEHWFESCPDRPSKCDSLIGGMTELEDGAA